MTLGNCLFHARKKCGFSQEDVAEKLGVSRQTIPCFEGYFISGMEKKKGEVLK